MPETFQALLIAIVVVLPGAVATVAFERYVGRYSTEFPERILRFLRGSALVFPLTAVMLWPFWNRVLHVAAGRHTDGSTRFVNLLADGGYVSSLWVLLPVAYVGTPAAAGTIAGRLWAAWLRRRPESFEDVRAWDWVFLDPAPMILVAKLRSGGWVAGVFGENSYVSPKGASSRDVYLEVALEVTDEGVLGRDESDTPVARTSAILFNAEDVEVLEVIPFGGDHGG